MAKNQDIIRNSNIVYSEASKKYGHSSMAVLHGDTQKQYIRFNEIIKFISLDENISILDVGCGNAEFYKFLNFNGFKGKYTGFDINSDLLNQAKTKYKNIDVQKIDILSDTIVKKYDYVIASGLLNYNSGQDMRWIYSMMTKLYSFANQAVIINSISTYVSFKQKEMFYLDPILLLDYVINNFTPIVTIQHGAIPHNFTIAFSKQKKWHSINN